ncbi:MAG: phosphoenolpyruvate--protein phosphotransferase [Halobaculum sp.]
MNTVDGVGVTPLAGVGTTHWYDPEVDLSPRPDPETVDPEAELAAFERARDEARSQLREEQAAAADRVGTDAAEVFEAHVQFLDDPQITEGVEEAVHDGTPAAHAVRDVFDASVREFEAMEGQMSERADDLRDVRDRLLRQLTDQTRGDDASTTPSRERQTSDPASLDSLPDGTVLLAQRLTPSETARLDADAVVGVATVEGGRTSHAAIFARALALPAVVGAGDPLEEIAAGRRALVDGDGGRIVVDPDDTPDSENDATAREGTRRAIPVRHEPVTTADGREIEVAANVGSRRGLDPALERGADGIGLLRTEFLFLDRETPPSETDQYETITTALESFAGDRVVVRTLDVGGDKSIPYLDLPTETNPFLGARGIRLSLGAHEDLFETQLRALLRAAASEHGDGLAVMFPMVSRPAELDDALGALEAAAASLDADGVAFDRPELGVMIETPAAVFTAEQLADRVDFLSIGTNDLTQYVMAASRESDSVTDLHDPTHPAVLRAIDATVEAGHERDAWVGMCGEMAGDPTVTELLVGLGLDELSTSAVTVPDVKHQVENVESDEARDLASRALDCETRADVRELLE